MCVHMYVHRYIHMHACMYVCVHTIIKECELLHILHENSLFHHHVQVH